MAVRAHTVARVGAVIMLAVGLGCGVLGVHVALNGAEEPLPTRGHSVEGILEDGPLTPSPAGAPFLYGEVRVADQPGPNAPHHRGNYGEPALAVRQASGDVVPVQFNSPDEWRLDDPDRDDLREVMSLARLPLVGAVDTERRLNPPFHVRVRALRPGDSVLVEVRNGVAIRTYVGERATHAELHARRESMRWPMVALLLLLGVVSVVGGVRLVRLKSNAASGPPDELE